MFNAIFEKCSDWLLPIIGGCLVWYGAHYFVLTPRIIAIDSKNNYSYDSTLPSNVNACLQARLGKQILKDGLMEAALYTATMKHLAEPYQQTLFQAQIALDDVCGISHARRIQLEKQRRAAQEAEERQQLKNQFNFWRKLLTGK